MLCFEQRKQAFRNLIENLICLQLKDVQLVMSWVGISMALCNLITKNVKYMGGAVNIVVGTS